MGMLGRIEFHSMFLENCPTINRSDLLLKARGMILVPMPGGLNDLADTREFDLPIQVAPCARRVGIKRRRISRTAFPFLHRHFHSRDLFDGLDHFAYRMWPPGAEVVEELGPGLREFRESRYVST